MTVPPTGVSSFPVIIKCGTERFAGNVHGLGWHLMLLLDQVPSLWQDRKAVCDANP